MYPPLALPPAPPLDDDDAARALRHALDADNPEAERVGAVHALRGAPNPFAAGRALAGTLNEPLLWLGSEVLACLDPRIAVGVDGRGRITASPRPFDELESDGDGERFCANLGVRVVPVRHAPRLAAGLPEAPAWLTAPPHGMAFLVVHRGARAPSSVAVVGPAGTAVVAGRHRDVEVVIQSSDVARRHARFVVNGGRLIVADLGSTNGTQVNERRIRAPEVLRAGDVVAPGAGHTFIVVDTVVGVDERGARRHARLRDGAGPLPFPRGAVDPLGDRHVVHLGEGRCGVVRYNPPAAVELPAPGGEALGVRVVDDGRSVDVGLR